MKRLLAMTFVAAALAGCGSDPSGPSSLVVEDLTVGTGATAVSGDTVSVHYILTLQNGTKVDSSYDRGQPFPFRLGTGAVIQGFDQGVTGMRVGGKRRLTIPPSLGYGNQAQNGIPANSTLKFDVELVSIVGK